MKSEIEHILNSGNVEERLDALLNAFSYGEDNLYLDLVVDALYNSSREVRSTACWLLQDREEINIKTSLINYCPYVHFQCINSIVCNEWVDPSVFSIAANGKVLVTDNHRKGSYYKNRRYQVRDLYTDRLLFESSAGIKIYRDVITHPKANSILTALYSELVIKIIDLYNGNLISEVDDYLAPPVSLCSDGKTIIFLDYEYDFAEGCINIKVLNTQTGKLVKTFKWYKKYSGSVIHDEQLVISSDEKIMLVVSGNENIWMDIEGYFYSLWDLNTKKLIVSKETVKNWNVDSIVVTLDRQYLASGIRNGRLKVWDLVTDKMLYSYTGNSPSIMTSGGKFVICADFKNILIYDLHTQKVICTLEGHKDRITDIVLSPDKQAIASYSIDGNIRVWSIPEKV